MTKEDKIKRIAQEFVSETINNATVICDPRAQLGEVIVATANQNINIHNTTLKMQQVGENTFEVGGVTHECGDIEMVIPRNNQRVLPNSEPSITINVDTELTEEIHSKLVNMINKEVNND
ncbi:MAG: hypothetical protein GY799_02045 [Desulfobulbaceae bacterium]|nr:hypothetical protein [Desulfobulbaceae bacterium]